MGITKTLSRISYFTLAIVYILVFFTFFILQSGITQAYSPAEINANRATTKYAFTDKTASAITMNIAGRTLTFKRDTKPPQPPPANSFNFTGSVYKFILQGNTDDNCREGVPEATPGNFNVAPRIASITIVASAIDNNPDPNLIDARLEFFHGNPCTNKDVEPAIQVKNNFGAELAVPATERAVGGDTTTEPADNCEASDSGPLGWILCPVIGIASTFTNFVFESFVIPFLEDVPVSTNENDGSYLAWKQFRLIGNIVLVGAMLAVVYAQVKGN
jgi:hypothetical protein